MQCDHSYVSSFELPATLTATSDPAEAFADCSLVFHAIPIQASVDVRCRNYILNFEPASFMRARLFNCKYAAVSDPSQAAYSIAPLPDFNE